MRKPGRWWGLPFRPWRRQGERGVGSNADALRTRHDQGEARQAETLCRTAYYGGCLSILESKKYDIFFSKRRHKGKTEEAVGWKLNGGAYGREHGRGSSRVR